MDRTIVYNKNRRFKLPKLNEHRMTSQERSRAFFILEGITGIGQFSLATGAFLAVNIQIFNWLVEGSRITFILSGILLLACALYVKLVIVRLDRQE